MSNFFRDILRDVDENYKSIYDSNYTFSSDSATTGPPIEYYITLTASTTGEIPTGAKVLYEDAGNYVNASVSGDEIIVKRDQSGNADVYVSIEPRPPVGNERISIPILRQR